MNCGWIAFESWMVKMNPMIKLHCENHENAITIKETLFPGIPAYNDLNSQRRRSYETNY